MARFKQLVRSDLSSCAVGCHACLTGAFVRSVLKSDHRLTSFEDGIVKLSLVFPRNASSEGRTFEIVLLCLKFESVLRVSGRRWATYHSAEGKEVVDDCVQVLLLVQVVNLKEVNGFQAVTFTTFQIQFDIFPLKDNTET